MFIGDLFLLSHYEIAEKNILARVRVQKDHPVFRGHFPGNPVLPGVCMIQLIKELIIHHFNKEMLLNQAASVKFLQILNPKENEEVDVAIQLEETNNNHVSIKASIFSETSIFFKLSATLSFN